MPGPVFKSSGQISQNKSLSGLGGIPLAEIVHWALIAVAVIATSYTVYSVWQGRRSGDVFRTREMRSVENLPAMLFEKELEPLSYYEQRALSRDLFHWDKEPTAANPSTPFAPDLTEGLRNLKLRGIVYDQNPQAIIQDTVDQKSYFVHQGDQLKGAVVKQIESDKVVLESAGKIIELLRQ